MNAANINICQNYKLKKCILEKNTFFYQINLRERLRMFHYVIPCHILIKIISEEGHV